jgi:hypothetical protein
MASADLRIISCLLAWFVPWFAPKDSRARGTMSPTQAAAKARLALTVAFPQQAEGFEYEDDEFADR